MTAITAPARRWQWPADRSTPRKAREAVRRCLAAWQLTSLTDDAVAVVSELVANSCVHARTPVGVTLWCTGHGIRGEIRDGSPVIPPARAYNRESRGLWIVVHLARAFWVTPVEGGKAACFILEEGQ